MSISWSFGGVDLSTYGVVTVVDDYQDMPEKRGSNITIPFKHGSIFAQKFFNERKITIGMAILSTTATAQDTKFDNMRANFSAFAQKVLACTREDATVRNAYASVQDPLQVEYISPLFARVVVQFTLADPIFRLSTAIADNTTTINTSPKAMTVTNPGTVEEREPTILLSGPLTNVVITNSTNGAVLTYTGAISSTDTVTIGTSNGEPYATHSVSGDVIGNVSHSGASALMVFDVGDNTLAITSDVATTGTVKASFNAPFL